MLALIVALILWKRKLEGRPTVIYVDNNSARDIVISASARSPIPSKLLEVFLEVEERCSIARGLLEFLHRQILRTCHPVNSKMNLLFSVRRCQPNA